VVLHHADFRVLPLKVRDYLVEGPYRLRLELEELDFDAPVLRATDQTAPGEHRGHGETRDETGDATGHAWHLRLRRT
jgi:hypothetical protein